MEEADFTAKGTIAGQGRLETTAQNACRQGGEAFCRAIYLKKGHNWGNCPFLEFLAENIHIFIFHEIVRKRIQEDWRIKSFIFNDKKNH